MGIQIGRDDIEGCIATPSSYQHLGRIYVCAGVRDVLRIPGIAEEVAHGVECDLPGVGVIWRKVHLITCEAKLESLTTPSRALHPMSPTTETTEDNRDSG
eukprot:7151819-Pyramimonas_sp.AAC.1